MLDDLKKYKMHGHFFFKPDESLAMACNAPNDKSGVYIVYSLKNGKIELIYIGRSGRLEKNGKMFVRKAGIGGMKDRIVNGHQFGKVPRRISWPKQMIKEKIEGLDVYWYVTHNVDYCDDPRAVEKLLLENHLRVFGRLPKWNNEI